MKQEPEETFGLQYWGENGLELLPLKQVSCSFTVTGALADIEMRQHFLNDLETPIDCTYTFPLPADAATYDCEIVINDRKLAIRSMENEAALGLVEDAADSGHRTLSINCERDNLFSLSLRNIQPEDHLIVVLCYFHPVDGFGRERSLRIPFTPGVRFVPVPLLENAAQLSPPRIDRSVVGAAQLKLEGKLDAGGALDGTPVSATHPVTISPSVDGIFNVTSDGSSKFPDRDFLLRWELPADAAETTRAWSDGEHALVEITAPDEVPVAEDYAQNIYFVLDRSGSMHGEKWRQATRALVGFLESLSGGDDRVMITLFDDQWEDLYPTPMGATELLDANRVQQLSDQAQYGGTYMLPALTHVFDTIDRGETDRIPSTIVLITDGQVGNEPDVLQLCAKHPHVRVHCFGIDDAVNDALLRTLAQQQGGICRLLTPGEDLRAPVAHLGSCMRRPVLFGVQIGEGFELAKQRIGDLFADQVLSIPLRIAAKEPLTLGATAADGSDWRIGIQPKNVSSRALELIWKRTRIAYLNAIGRHSEAIDLAIASNLICDGVSYVAIDPEVVAGSPAQIEIHQPSMVCTEGFIEFDCSPETASEDSVDLRRLLSMGLNELDSPEEVLRLLANASVKTIGALVTMSRESLRKIGLTDSDINSVEEQLNLLGLTLGMQIDPSLLAADSPLPVS